MAAKKSKKRSVTGELRRAALGSRVALSRRLARHEIYPGQDALLLVVSKDDGISLRDLADRLGVKPPTVTKTVARLSARGLLEKRISTEDGRRSHAHLTEAGLGLVAAIEKSGKAVERAALKGFSDKETKAFRKMLRKVVRNLSDACEEPRQGQADG